MLSTKCGHCRGTGRIKLTGPYLETYKLLVKHGKPVHGAALASLAGCTPQAMNNRLAYLEARGLASSERYGRVRRFVAKQPPS